MSDNDTLQAADVPAASAETERADILAQIEEHRAQIDGIDKQLLALLNDRAELSLAIRQLKAQVGMGLYAPQREASIVEALQAANDGPLYNENIAEIYKTILEVMRKLSC